MANTNKPFGFAPVRTIAGGSWGEQATMYYIPSTDPSAYYIGDAVISAAAGDANGIPGVAKATAGTETLRGVIVGVLPVTAGISIQGTPLNLEVDSIPATKTRDYYVMVVDDPNVIFAMQGDATATNQTAANCNKNASFTVAAGATTLSASGSVINSGSINTNNTLNLKLMGLQQFPNNAFGAYAVWLVKINLHELSGSGTTAI